MRNTRWIALAPLVLACAACVVGPDYAPPTALGFQGEPGFRRGDADVVAAPPAARWWDAFGDPVLTGLIDEALAASPNVEAAAARVRSARAQARRTGRDRSPKISGSSLYLNADLPGASFSSGEDGGGDQGLSAELYNLGANASWEIDAFGRLRRLAERDAARAGGVEADLADVQVALTVDIARAYVDLRNRQGRRATQARLIVLIDQQLGLMRQRRAAGTASDSDLNRLETARQTAVASTASLEADLTADLDALSALVGLRPGGLDDRLAATAPTPVAPQRVEVGDPAGLLQRRPDIRKAERDLAAAVAGVGVAQAQRFPAITLRGVLGMGGADAADVLDAGAASRILAPTLSWTFLDFGRTRAAVQGAQAERDAAQAVYDARVLAALQDAEAALARFSGQRRAAAAADGQADLAHAAWRVSRRRFEGGTLSRIEMLDAERAAVTADDERAQAYCAATLAFVTLQSSLGLGWSAPPAV